MPSNRPYTLEELAEGFAASASIDDWTPTPAFWTTTMTGTWISSLCQIADLSSLGLTFGQAGNNADWGTNSHWYRDGTFGAHITGTYGPREGHEEAAAELPPGRKLELPEWTLLNPRSFVGLGEEYWQLRLGFEIVEEMDAEGKLGPPTYRRRQGPPPTPPPSWPTNDPPNYSNDRTPMNMMTPLMQPLAAAARRVKRGAAREDLHHHGQDDFPGQGNSSVSDVVESGFAESQASVEVLTDLI